MNNETTFVQKEKRKCEWCKTEISADAVFCPNCGQKRKEIQELEKASNKWFFAGLCFMIWYFPVLIPSLIEHLPQDMAKTYIDRGTGFTIISIASWIGLICVGVGLYLKIKSNKLTKKKLDL